MAEVKLKVPLDSCGNDVSEQSQLSTTSLNNWQEVYDPKNGPTIISEPSDCGNSFEFSFKNREAKK